MNLRKALNKLKRQQKKDRIERYNGILCWEKMKRRTLFSNYQRIYYNKDRIHNTNYGNPRLEITTKTDEYTIYRYKIYYKLDKPFIYWERQIQLKEPVKHIITSGINKGRKEIHRYRITTNFREFRNINDLFKYIKQHDIQTKQLNNYIRNNKDLNIFFRVRKIRKLFI